MGQGVFLAMVGSSIEYVWWCRYVMVYICISKHMVYIYIYGVYIIIYSYIYILYYYYIYIYPQFGTFHIFFEKTSWFVGAGDDPTMFGYVWLVTFSTGKNKQKHIFDTELLILCKLLVKSAQRTRWIGNRARTVANVVKPSRNHPNIAIMGCKYHPQTVG